MSTIALSSHAAPKISTRRPAPQHQPRRQRKSSFKLTRRGRFVLRGLPLLTVAALLILGAISFLHPSDAQADSHSSQSAVTQMVTVKGGQSLWDIAENTGSSSDTRDVVEQIMDLNNLSSTSIDAGQVLEVPLYSEK